MKAKQRMYLTGTRERLVEEGHADAAYLYASIGDTIPDSAVDKFKIVGGYLTKADQDRGDKADAATAKVARAEAKATAKAAKKAEDKAGKPDQDKSGGLTIDVESKRIK